MNFDRLRMHRVLPAAGYLFGIGSGQDTITENDATAGNADTIRLKAGVLPSDVKLSRDNNALILSINGTTDNLTIFIYQLIDGGPLCNRAVEEQSALDCDFGFLCPAISICARAESSRLRRLGLFSGLALPTEDRHAF